MSEYVNKTNNDDEITIDFGVIFCDVWKGFKKFWWIFLIICSFAATLNYSQKALRYTPMYESKVSFTVSTLSNYDETNTSYGFYYNQSTAAQLEKLFPYILQSDIMQALIKEELGTPGINGSITAEAIPNSNLFTIKVVSSDSAAPKEILEATIKHLPEVTKYVIGQTRLNIIQPATTPKEAYNKPDYRIEAVKGFLFGAAVCCLILAAYAFSRKTVKKVDDFQSVLNMKCLGVIPYVKFKAHNKKIDSDVSLLNDKVDRPFIESVKSLSLKTERRMNEDESKVLMVTSTLPNEGKSTAALNLALTLSQTNKKVLLIDMDLRNPTQAQNLKVGPEDALLEKVLKNEITSNEALLKISDTFYFIGAYNSCRNISDLLTRGTLSELICSFRLQMDYIIVDTPPCATVSDALIISEACDSTLYVIRQDAAAESDFKRCTADNSPWN